MLTKNKAQSFVAAFDRTLAKSAIVLLLIIGGCQAVQVLASNKKPQIEPGTQFQQTHPGSRVYTEVPKDRPVITNYNAHR